MGFRLWSSPASYGGHMCSDPAATSLSGASGCAQEAERVMATFKEHLHLPVTMIDDSQRMLNELKARLSRLIWSSRANPHAPSPAVTPCSTSSVSG